MPLLHRRDAQPHEIGPGCGDDHVHDAFVELARQSPPPPALVLPWLYRVVRNKALAASRSSIRQRRRENAASKPEACAWALTADGDRQQSHRGRQICERIW